MEVTQADHTYNEMQILQSGFGPCGEKSASRPDRVAQLHEPKSPAPIPIQCFVYVQVHHLVARIRQLHEPAVGALIFR
jgi:hypothetical protein